MDDGDGFIGGCLAIFAIVILVVSFFVSIIITSNAKPEHSPAELAKLAFGLESDKEYPLQFGSRIEGSSGYASASSGFFSSRATVNLSPASSLSVAYHRKDQSYVLEIPMSKIVFTQQNAPETIKFKLDEGGDYRYTGLAYGIRFRGIFIPGQGTKPIEENWWYQDLVDNRQLGEFLARPGTVQSVEVSLTPENYEKILNG